MSEYKSKEDFYKRSFKVSLIASLFLLTIIFYIFPKFAKLSNREDKIIDIKIYVSDIPKTNQRKTAAAPPPAKPYGFIPIPVEEADFPEEISLSKFPGTGLSQENVIGIAPEIPPKPILEVYPTVSGLSCSGYIRLLLLVNKNGIAESIEIIENTTQLDTCLNLAIMAARKSRWIPAKVNKKSVDTWVTKTYKFNVKQ
jgi:hypothetical protein